MAEIQNIIASIKGSELAIKIITCIGLVLFGYIFHLVTRGWITKAFKRRELEKLLSSKKVYTLTTFLLSAIKYLVYFIVVYLICKILGVPIDSFFLAIAGAGSVAFGLGAQTIVKNILNGFFILIEDQYSVGDTVSIGNLTGTVEEIGIRTTKIRTLEGYLHVIPNGEINVITNMTYAKAMVFVNLPYEANAEKVLEVLKDEMGKVTLDSVKNQPTVDGITTFGQNGFTVRIIADCNQGESYAAERALRLIIKSRFEAEKIPLPDFYPIAVSGE